jgi:hypothetical protein
MISFTPLGIAEALARGGYLGVVLDEVEFVGITTGSEFCYKISFFDEVLGEQCTGKVFLTFDPASNEVTASY